MNTFELARKKHEKNLERRLRAQAEKELEIAEEKEEVIEVKKRPEPLVVEISGPVSLRFEVDYQGTLLASQSTPENLTEMFRKQLAAFGRVR